MSNIDMTSQTLYQMITETAQRYPQRFCIQIMKSHQLEQFTYHTLMHKVAYFIQKLLILGIKPGQRIIILADNCIETVAVLLALSKIRATIVMIDTSLPITELNQQIDFMDAGMILTSDLFVNQIQSLPRLNIAVYNIQQDLSAEHECPNNIANQLLDNDDSIAIIMLTSGTTGQPKGVMLSQHNLSVTVSEKYRLLFPLHALSIFPLYHIGPLVSLFSGLRNGVTMTLTSHHCQQQIMPLCQQVKPHIIGVVPSLLQFMHTTIQSHIKTLAPWQQTLIKLRLGGCYRFAKMTHINLAGLMFPDIRRLFGGKLRYIMSAAAPLDITLTQQMKNYGFIINNTYGLTECTGGGSRTLGLKNCEGSVGKPPKEIQCRIDNPNPLGEGEICLQSPRMMMGYFRNPQATQQAIKDNWLHTGDLGRIDAQGLLWILGRINDIIVTADGKKIHPQTLETHYQTIEGIDEVAVVGIVEQIHLAAVTTLDHTHHAQLRERILTLATSLPTHWYPQHIHFLTELPKTSLLKIRRNELKQRLNHLTIKTEMIAPANPLEQTLFDICLPLLNISTLSTLDNWFEQGGNSMFAVAFTEQIRQVCQRTISIQIIYQYPTIQLLAKYLTQTTNDNTTSVYLPLAEEVNEQIQLVPISEGPLLIPQSTNKIILMTGVTGFLGQYLLKQLLTTSSAKLICLVRADHDEQAKQRIQQLLARFDISTDIINQRITVYATHHLEHEYLGLSPACYQQLAATVDSIIHIAGNTSFVQPYAQLKTANVCATRRLLAFALQHTKKYFHFISSRGVHNSIAYKNKASITEDDPLPPGHQVFGGYPQSKWVAEQLVMFFAKNHDLTATIYRAGAISAGPDQYWNKQQMTYQILEYLRQFSQFPLPDKNIQIDICPVDYASTVMVDLILQQKQPPSPAPTIAHIVNPHAFYSQQILPLLQRLNIPCQPCSIQTIGAQIQQQGASHPLYHYAPLFMEQVEPGLLAAEASLMIPPLSCQQTNQYLTTDIICPSVEGLLTAYFQNIATHA